MRSDARRYDVAGIGSIVLDRIHRVSRLLGPDEKAPVHAGAGQPSTREMPGGVVLNHLAWARLLGLRVAIFGRQAPDAPGRLLRSAMDRLGIARYIDQTGVASSCADIFVDDAGERAIYMARAATGDTTSGDIDRHFAGIIGAAAIVTTEVSQLPLAAVIRVLERAREAGAATVLDVDIPPSDAVPWLGTTAELMRAMQAAKGLKLSRKALAGLVDSGDVPSAARVLRERCGAEWVAVTLGQGGAWLCDASGATYVPAASVSVADTTGAGDAFLGGLLAGLHLALSTRDVLALANACGAACCERTGGFPDDPLACRARALAHYASLEGAPLTLAPFAPERDEMVEPETQSFLQVVPEQLARVAKDTDTRELRRAARLILGAEEQGGRLHLTGIGKPAHVASYGAAMLASTGTAAYLLDASEATHGSVGQIRSGDVVIAISNSGTTPELIGAIDAAHGMGAGVVAITSDPESALAQRAEVVLLARVTDEGCPLGLAPRASVLAQVLVLSALSVELQAAKQFDRAQYHRRHPAGALGRRSRG